MLRFVCFSFFACAILTSFVPYKLQVYFPFTISPAMAQQNSETGDAGNAEQQKSDSLQKLMRKIQAMEDKLQALAPKPKPPIVTQPAVKNTTPAPPVRTLPPESPPSQNASDKTNESIITLKAAIDAVDSMVNGIGARLLESTGVRQKTIINVLDDSDVLLTNSLELLGQSRTLKGINHLIEVDIFLFYALSNTISGKYQEAAEHIITAQTKYNDICGKISIDLSCRQREAKILLVQARLEFLKRPETTGSLKRVKMLAEEAIKRLDKMISEEQANTRPRQSYLNELITRRGRAQIIAARAALRRAGLVSRNEKGSELQYALRKSSQCLKDSGTYTAAEVQRGACTSIEALTQYQRQTGNFTQKARKAVALLNQLNNDKSNEANLPIKLEFIHARLYLGLILHSTGKLEGDDLQLFIKALEDFRNLTKDNSDNFTLRNRFIQLSKDILEGQWLNSLTAGSSLYKAIIKTLETRADHLVQRLQDLKSSPQPEAIAETEALRLELARTLEELLFRYYETNRTNEVVQRFDNSQHFLPLPRKDEITPSQRLQNIGAGGNAGAYLASTLKVYYWAAQALRDERSEGRAMQTLLTVEANSRELMQNASGQAGSDQGNSDLYRYLFGFSIRSLGDFRLQVALDRETSTQLTDQWTSSARRSVPSAETLLTEASNRIEEAANNNSQNLEFRYALGDILQKRGKFFAKRRLMDKAEDDYRRAADLGSTLAAKQLSTWYRTATGPRREKNISRADQYQQLRRNRVVFKFNLTADSPILPGTKKFVIYLSPGTDGRDLIATEKKRLKYYYGVKKINSRSEGRLHNIYAKAVLRAGTGSNVTYTDLRDANQKLIEEHAKLKPFEGSLIEAELMASRDELENGDFAKALAKIENTKLLNQTVTDSLDDATLKAFGLAALQLLKIAEAVDRDVASNVSERAKDAFRKAMQRLLDRTLDANIQTGTSSRAEQFEQLAQSANKLYRSYLKNGKRVSYESNTDYAEQYIDVTTKLQQRAIEVILTDRRRIQSQDTIFRLMVLYRKLGDYFYEGASSNDQSLSDGFLQSSMGAYVNAQGHVAQLIQLSPEWQPHKIENIKLSQKIVEVHKAFGERKVALRLIGKVADNVDDLLRSQGRGSPDIKLMEVAAKVHRQAGDIEREIAGQVSNEYIIAIIQTEYSNKKTLSRDKLDKLKKNRKRLKRVFDEHFNQAMEYYKKASNLYFQIVLIDPDNRLRNRIAGIMRKIVTLLQSHDYLFKPGADDQYKSVTDYLEKEVKAWQERVRKSAEGTEQRRQQLSHARVMALRADIDRILTRQVMVLIYKKDLPADAPIPKKLTYQMPHDSYRRAIKEFDKLSYMSNAMEAEYAILLNDLGYFYLVNLEDEKARKVLEKAYAIWKKLPNNVWDEIEIADLNIPANYAHMRSVDGKSKEAVRIYENYKGRVMRISEPERNWDDLVVCDLAALKKTRNDTKNIEKVLKKLEKDNWNVLCKKS